METSESEFPILTVTSSLTLKWKLSFKRWFVIKLSPILKHFVKVFNLYPYKNDIALLILYTDTLRQKYVTIVGVE